MSEINDKSPSPEEIDDVLPKFFSRGGSLRMLTDIAEQDLAQIYSYACQLFSEGDFAAARNFYQLLSTLDHWNFDYLLGLGLCHQRLSVHGDAITCFARAGVINVEDPRAAFFAGISYRMIGHEDGAKKAFHAAIRWCGEQPNYQDIKDSAEEMLSKYAEK